MTLPVFLRQPAPKDATPWTILSWGSTPLHGVTQSLRQRPLDRRHLSWGSYAPSAFQEERVHVSSSCPDKLPGGAGILPGGPTLPATEPLAGFLNLSAAFFLSPPSCHFQAGNARGVNPSGVYSFARSPGDSSPPACPLDVPPAGCAAPDPRRGHPRARCPAS
jgi:hypothetical protein